MMRLVAGLVVAGLVAGCGASDERAASTPAPTLDPAVYGPARPAPDVKIPVPLPKPVAPSAAVASALASGEVGVVDSAGQVGVRPKEMETSSDGTLGQLRWDSWGASGASGHGELSILVCNPSCSMGPTKKIPATVTLSGLKTCDGRRYFDGAVIHIDPADSPSEGEQPAAYVRAPC